MTPNRNYFGASRYLHYNIALKPYFDFEGPMLLAFVVGI